MSKAFIVVGLGFGDEGKGKTVDRLTRTMGAKWNVRFNGGPQAAHNVVLENGLAHTFSQFGSGYFAGAKTFLSRFCAFDPVGALNEAVHLAVMLEDKRAFKDNLFVDKESVVITPYHKAINRLREFSREAHVHGSTGIGFGEAIADSEANQPTLRVKHLVSKEWLTDQLTLVHAHQMTKLGALRLDRLPARGDVGLMELRRLTQYPVEVAEKMFTSFKTLGAVSVDSGFIREVVHDTSVFEGAQGVLLDQVHGFFPYVTRSNTTFKNAETLILESILGSGNPVEMEKVGVIRTYHTRHGAGPFPSEDRSLDPKRFDSFNGSESFAGRFRVGHFDYQMFKYALRVVGGVDNLSITHTDNLPNNEGIVVENYKDAEDHIALHKHKAYGVNQQETYTLTNELMYAEPGLKRYLKAEALVERIADETKDRTKVLRSTGPKVSDWK